MCAHWTVTATPSRPFSTRERRAKERGYLSSASCPQLGQHSARRQSGIREIRGKRPHSQERWAEGRRPAGAGPTRDLLMEMLKRPGERTLGSRWLRHPNGKGKY